MKLSLSKQKEGYEIDGIWEQGAKENIWAYDGGSSGKLEKTAYWGTS